LKVLLDTHYLIWIAEGKVSAEEIKFLKENELFISPISFFEISLKYSLGKLTLGTGNPELFEKSFQKKKYNELPLSSSLLATYYKLPKKDNHKDPFDRMLIWQAIQEDYIILSKDEKFKQYTNDGLMLKTFH